jgi:hypothetical protein
MIERPIPEQQVAVLVDPRNVGGRHDDRRDRRPDDRGAANLGPVVELGE